MAETQNSISFKKNHSPLDQITNNNYQFVEHHFPKRPSLDLSFSDLTYTTRTWARLRPGKLFVLFIQTNFICTVIVDYCQHLLSVQREKDVDLHY